MSKKLTLVTDPNPVLHRPTQPVKLPLTSAIRKLIPQMVHTCREAKGVGLAAPQIGQSLRLAIVNLEDWEVAPFALINPKIISRSWRKESLEEGCLSLPGMWKEISRHKKVTVRMYTPAGKKIEFHAEGFLARVLQHEIDHLDGILIADRK
jgi:peptide deformylase